MSVNKKRQWEDEVIAKLQPERDKMQAQLDNIREMRMNISLASREKRREFLMKIGELSLIVGAAITPVVIVSDGNIRFQEFAVMGVGLYLINGIFALWRCRTLLYQDAEDAPHVGLDQEAMLQPVIHSYNKLLYDPSSTIYQSEHIDASKALVDESGEIEAQQEKAKPDFWADAVLYGFVLATLFVARTIWPFGNLWYAEMLLGFALLVCILLLTGYRHMQKSRAKLEKKHARIQTERADYQEWHNKEIFKR